MKGFMKYLFILLGSIFLAACAHHPDVRPGVEGIHRVALAADDKDKGAQEAISQAQNYCYYKHDKPAVFIDENAKYEGSMSEDTYNTAKTVSTVAKVLGGVGWATRTKTQQRSKATGLGVGGMVADAALGDAYKIEMKFKCEEAK